jgi:hypothetical protein
MCFTANPTWEWAGSTLQVPVGIEMLVVVDMLLLEFGPAWRWLKGLVDLTTILAASVD